MALARMGVNGVNFPVDLSATHLLKLALLVAGARGFGIESGPLALTV